MINYNIVKLYNHYSRMFFNNKFTDKFHLTIKVQGQLFKR